MSLIINLASKLARTNQKCIVIKTSFGKDVYLKNYVLCFLRNAKPVSIQELFKHSLNLPDYILKSGDDLKVYVGKGENGIFKTKHNTVYQMFWDLDEEVFSHKEVFYSIEYVERIDIKIGRY
jgi:hypothetical protein